MIDLKNLNRLVEQIADERGINKEKILGVVESAIAAAYKKEYGKRGEIIKAKMDPKTGEIDFWQVKEVVDKNTVETETKELRTGEDRLPFYNPDRHIFIEEAKKIKKKIAVGEELEFPLEGHEDLGRIAAKAAKQVILQKIREEERESIKSEYGGKEGEIVSGVVQRIEHGNVYVDLGRAIGVMFFNETIPGGYYRIGEGYRF